MGLFLDAEDLAAIGRMLKSESLVQIPKHVVAHLNSALVEVISAADPFRPVLRVSLPWLFGAVV